MQNLVTSMNISAYVDGNDVMFLFKDVTEDQKKQLMKLAQDMCNAGVNTFSTLAPRETVPMNPPAVENMQPVVTTPTEPATKLEVTVEKAAETTTAATEEKEYDGPGAEIYAMSKKKRIDYLRKNVDSGTFVGYDNLVRAYAYTDGASKDDIESKLATGDAKAIFESLKSRIEMLLEANKPAFEF